MSVPVFYFTKQDILDYMSTNGKESAFGLLLLAGPDSFESYEEYKELEKMLTE